MPVEVTEQVVRVEVVAGPTITITESVPRVTETGPAQVTVQETVTQVVVTAPETVVVSEEVVRLVHVGVTDPLLTVKEGGVVVDSAVSVLDFIEPDAVLITSSPAGEANIDMSRYALLAGRNPAQALAGGTLTGQQFMLRANAIDATGVLTLDPTLSTLAGALTVSDWVTATVGLKTNTISERTAAAGVTIDTALIKDGSFQVPDNLSGIKDDSGILVIVPSVRYLKDGNGNPVFNWGYPLLAYAFGESPNMVGADAIAPIGGRNLFNAASVCLGYFSNSPNRTGVAGDEGYFRFQLVGPNGLVDFARLKVVARDVLGGTEDGALLFQVAKAGALTTVLGVEQYGVDVTGTLGVTGLSTLTGHIRLAANGEIQDSAGAPQIIVSTTPYQVNLPNDVIVGGLLDVLGAMTAVDLTLSGILTVDSLSVGTGAVFDGSLTANAGIDMSGTATLPAIAGINAMTMAAAGTIKDSGGFARVTLNAGAGNAVTLNDSAAVARLAVKSTTPFVALSSSTTLNSTLGVI